MKYALALTLVASAVTALTLPQGQQKPLNDQPDLVQDKYLIELNPGETRWVTEDEKWALRRVHLSTVMCQRTANMIITGRPQLHGHNIQP